MSTEDTPADVLRFSPLAVAESYKQQTAQAWKEYMITITQPWINCQAKIKECVRQIALDTKKNTPKQNRLLLAACEEYGHIAGAAFANYIATLEKAYYLECMKNAGLDVLTVATIANKAKAAMKDKAARRETMKKFSKPTPKYVTKKGKGIAKGKGKN